MKHTELGLRFTIAVFVLTCNCCLRAQVVELSGGTSTLFQSQGGTITVHGRSYSGSVGAGTVQGQFFGGAQLIKSNERASLIFGTDNIPFDLPTDIFQSGHYLTGIGVGLRARIGSTNLYTFGGETSTSFNSPFFEGARAQTPAGILFASRKVAPQWTAATRVIFSKQVTILHSFSWDSGNGAKFAISGGVGSNEPYIASSFEVERPRYDLQAAYIETGSQFRRANVAVPLTSEPDRDNVLFTMRPSKWLSVSAGRQNYMNPIYSSLSNLRSTVNQAGGDVHLSGFSASAMLFQSNFGNANDLAMAYSATQSLGSRVQAQCSYLISKPEHAPQTKSFVTTMQESLTPRWNISQVLNTSGGRNTFGFGGSFLSNFATLSADYQTYYVPARVTAPFEQALIVNAQVHLFGRLSIGGGTFVAPDGKLLYTVQAQGTISAQMAGVPNAAEHHPFGDMVIRGRVVDTAGRPVMGAALMLGQLPVYTDSQGYFYVRERKSREHPLTVLTDQFLDGSLYRVVSAPPDIRSGRNVGMETVVVVAKVTAARN